MVLSQQQIQIWMPLCILSIPELNLNLQLDQEADADAALGQESGADMCHSRFGVIVTVYLVIFIGSSGGPPNVIHMQIEIHMQTLIQMHNSGSAF